MTLFSPEIGTSYHVNKQVKNFFTITMEFQKHRLQLRTMAHDMCWKRTVFSFRLHVAIADSHCTSVGNLLQLKMLSY